MLGFIFFSQNCQKILSMGIQEHVRGKETCVEMRKQQRKEKLQVLVLGKEDGSGLNCCALRMGTIGCQSLMVQNTSNSDAWRILFRKYYLKYIHIKGKTSSLRTTHFPTSLNQFLIQVNQGFGTGQLSFSPVIEHRFFRQITVCPVNSRKVIYLTISS